MQGGTLTMHGSFVISGILKDGDSFKSYVTILVQDSLRPLSTLGVRDSFSKLGTLLFSDYSSAMAP